jgi:hypothetical protein
VNCGIDFKPTRPLEVGGSGNTWGYPCPICEFQVTPGGETDARLTLPAGDFEPQLTRLLADARARGVPPQELMRVLRDELKFTMELAHPGRRMMLNIIDLGEQEGSGGTLTMRDNRELPNGRSLVK